MYLQFILELTQDIVFIKYLKHIEILSKPTKIYFMFVEKNVCGNVLSNKKTLFI